MAIQDTLKPVIKQVLTNAKLVLDATQLNSIENETCTRYEMHVRACLNSGADPDPVDRFVIEIAEQVRKGIYEAPQRLTAKNDDGCRKLFNQVCVASWQKRRLDGWHKKYVQTCNEGGLTAFALSLILDAVNHAQLPLTLFKDSLSTQVERINALVTEYVKVAGRKENSRWYARVTTRRKPSRLFNKYAD
ncbi:MAG TPA: hypothetical protein VGB07_36225 [Blastocatellia bacterium]